MQIPCHVSLCVIFSPLSALFPPIVAHPLAFLSFAAHGDNLAAHGNNLSAQWANFVAQGTGNATQGNGVIAPDSLQFVIMTENRADGAGFLNLQNLGKTVTIKRQEKMVNMKTIDSQSKDVFLGHFVISHYVIKELIPPHTQLLRNSLIIYYNNILL
jgi:hypothetical protein